MRKPRRMIIVSQWDSTGEGMNQPNVKEIFLWAFKWVLLMVKNEWKDLKAWAQDWWKVSKERRSVLLSFDKMNTAWLPMTEEEQNQLLLSNL